MWHPHARATVAPLACPSPTKRGSPESHRPFWECSWSQASDQPPPASLPPSTRWPRPASARSGAVPLLDLKVFSLACSFEIGRPRPERLESRTECGSMRSTGSLEARDVMALALVWSGSGAALWAHSPQRSQSATRHGIGRGGVYGRPTRGNVTAATGAGVHRGGQGPSFLGLVGRSSQHKVRVGRFRAGRREARLCQ